MFLFLLHKLIHIFIVLQLSLERKLTLVLKYFQSIRKQMALKLLIRLMQPHEISDQRHFKFNLNIKRK